MLNLTLSLDLLKADLSKSKLDPKLLETMETTQEIYETQQNFHNFPYKSASTTETSKNL